MHRMFLGLHFLSNCIIACSHKGASDKKSAFFKTHLRPSSHWFQCHEFIRRQWTSAKTNVPYDVNFHTPSVQQKLKFFLRCDSWESMCLPPQLPTNLKREQKTFFPIATFIAKRLSTIYNFHVHFNSWKVFVRCNYWHNFQIMKWWDGYCAMHTCLVHNVSYSSSP